MSKFNDKYDYSVIPQHVWDSFMEKTGNHKEVPLGVVHRMMTGDFYEEVKNDLPENLQPKFCIERIHLFRAYAMEHGKIGRFDPTFFEPSKSDMYDCIKGMLGVHAGEIEYMKLMFGPFTKKEHSIIRMVEIVNGYEKFR